VDILCQKFKVHYQEERPRQGLGNELVISDSRSKKRSKSIEKPSETDSIQISEIHCQEPCGGLLKSYSNNAV